VRLLCPTILERTLPHAPHSSGVRGRCATNGGEVVAQRLEEVAAARAGPPAESAPSTPRGGAAGTNGAARRPGQPARAGSVRLRDAIVWGCVHDPADTVPGLDGVVKSKILLCPLCDHTMVVPAWSHACMSLHAAADTDVCVCTKRFRTSLLGKLPVALFFVGPTRRDVGMSDCAARSGRYMMHRHNERDKVEVPDWCATRTDGAGTLPDPVWQGSCASTLALCQSHEAMGGTASHAAQCSDEVVAVSEHPARCSAGEAALPGESNPKPFYTPQPLHRRPARYTRGLPPSAAPQPSELARDLAELSQRSASGAEGAGGRAASPEGTPRGAAPLQLQHWRLLEGGEALPVCRDSVRVRPTRRTGWQGQGRAARILRQYLCKGIKQRRPRTRCCCLRSRACACWSGLRGAARPSRLRAPALVEQTNSARAA
jgi:hypothetical protein